MSETASQSLIGPPIGPLIGLPACSKQIGDQIYHTVGDKYVRAVAEASEAVPLVFPALAELSATVAILDGLDGIGHTSGWDAMAGAVLTLDTWLQAHRPAGESPQPH